jgi:hypothetical protein
MATSCFAKAGEDNTPAASGGLDGNQDTFFFLHMKKPPGGGFSKLNPLAE